MNTNTKVKGLENARVFRIKAGTFINPKYAVPGTGFINISTYPTKIEIDLEILGDYAYDYLPQISYNLGMSVDELKNLLFNYDADSIKKKITLEKDLKIKKEKLEKELLERKKNEAIGEDHPIKKYIQTIDDRIKHLNDNKDINSGSGPILFRVSIPFWRIQEGSYCGDIYVSKENFLKGLLIFNKSFGRFCVNVLPEHRFLFEDFYNNFIKMLQTIQMDDRAFFFACPEEGNRAYNIGHFCTVCLKNKVKKNKRKVIKAIDYFKSLNEEKLKNMREKIDKDKIILKNLSIKNIKKIQR